MKVKELKEILSMMPNDMEIHIRTKPTDFSHPLNTCDISVMKANYTKKYGLDREFLMLTAYIPDN